MEGRLDKKIFYLFILFKCPEFANYTVLCKEMPSYLGSAYRNVCKLLSDGSGKKYIESERKNVQVIKQKPQNFNSRQIWVEGVHWFSSYPCIFLTGLKLFLNRELETVDLLAELLWTLMRRDTPPH